MYELRWQQRFENFEKAFALLNAILLEPSPNDYIREATVQRFEIVYELAWKTLKDYLEFSGNPVILVSARNVVKMAFEAKIIRDGDVWLDMTEWRNKTVHEYDINIIRESFGQIKDKFVPVINDAYLFLKAEI